MMVRFIDIHRDYFEVEPIICYVLSENQVGGFIASGGYRAAKKHIPLARTLKDQPLNS